MPPLVRWESGVEVEARSQTHAHPAALPLYLRPSFSLSRSPLLFPTTLRSCRWTAWTTEVLAFEWRPFQR
jgi:hypothetical protein